MLARFCDLAHHGLRTSGRDTAWGFGWIWCMGCLVCRDELLPFPAPHPLQLLPTWQSRGASSELMKILLLSPAAEQLSGMPASEPVWKYITEWTCNERKKKNIATAALPEPPGPALAALHPCSWSNGYLGEKEEQNLIKPYLNATSVKWTFPNNTLWKINIVYYSCFTGKENVYCNRQKNSTARASQSTLIHFYYCDSSASGGEGQTRTKVLRFYQGLMLQQTFDPKQLHDNGCRKIKI